MRCLWCLAAALLLAMGSSPVAAQDGPAGVQVDPERVEKLIQQLGSARFADRARARAELDKIGSPALERLRQAEKSEDAEVRRVAGDLVKNIERHLLNARILAPKRIHLKVEDLPVPQAVAELARQSGYSIQIQGDQTALAARKITLDTGETTFWKALDQLCQKAGLVEGSVAAQFSPVPGRVRSPRILRVPLAPVLPAPPVQPAIPGQVKAAAVAQVVIAQAGAPAVVQVQVPAQAQPALPVGPAIAGRVAYPGRPGLPNNGQIVVHAGKAEALPTCYAGAVRIRAIPPLPGVVPPPGEMQVYLEVTAEPRLQQFVVNGSPQLKKAVDDQRQTLLAAADPVVPGNPGIIARPAIGRAYYMMPNQAAGRQTMVLRLKAGAKRAKALKELSGSFTAQTQTPTETVLKVDNVLKAAGQKAKGENGGSMELASITKEPNGDYKVQVRLENLPGQNPFGGMAVFPGGQIQVQVQVVGNVTVVNTATGPGVPSLVDAKGKAYQLVQIPSRGVRGFNGAFTQEMTLVFRPQAGQGEPASMILTGQRSVTVPIAFRLENVPLP